MPARPSRSRCSRARPAPRRLRRRVHRGLRGGTRRDRRHRRGRRPGARDRVGRRPGQPRHAVSKAKDFIGQATRSRGHRRLGHRHRARRAGRAEQDPLHLGSCRGRRHHRRQRVHARAARPTRTSRPPGRSSATPPARRSSCSRRTPHSAGNLAAVQAVLGGQGRPSRACSWPRTPPSSPVRAAAARRRARPRLRRVGRRLLGRDVDCARPAGRVRRGPVVTGSATSPRTAPTARPPATSRSSTTTSAEPPAPTSRPR